MWSVLLETLKKKQWCVAGILLVAILGVAEAPDMRTWFFYNTDDTAWKIVAYGLNESPNSPSIEFTVSKWKRNRWGAQIGSLRVLCGNKDVRLHEIMSEQQIKKVCRMVQ